MRVEREEFFRDNTDSYIFRRSGDALTHHCHHEAGNSHMYVGCCGGSGSTNCGANNVVELVYMRAIRSSVGSIGQFQIPQGFFRSK